MSEQTEPEAETKPQIDLFSAILTKLPKTTEPIEVRIVLDDNYRPVGGPNRGNMSIGLYVDDTHLPADKRLATNDLVKKYKNIVFIDIELMKKLIKKTQRVETVNGVTNGYIKIPGDLTPDKTGAYWLNHLPAFAV